MSDRKDDFAELRTGFEISVGSDSFGERKYAVNDRPKVAGGNKFHHGVQLGLGAHVGAEERKLAAEKKAEINLGVVAGRSPASDQAASSGQASEAVVPSGRANVFEDNIYTALIGDAVHFIADFLRFVVDKMVGAELLCFLHFFVGARSGKYSRAEKFCDLNRGATNAATRPEDENILAGLQLCAGYQHVPRRLEDQRN